MGNSIPWIHMLVLAPLACSPRVVPGGAPGNPHEPDWEWVSKSFTSERRTQGTPATPSVLTRVLQRELAGSMPRLAKESPPVYHAALGVSDTHQWVIKASGGVLIESTERQQRRLDADFRVGSPALDNSHPRADAKWSSTGWALPTEDDEVALVRGVERAMDDARRKASQEWAEVQAEIHLSGSGTDRALPDFDGPRKAVTYAEAPAVLEADRGTLEQWVRKWSAELAQHSAIEDSAAEITVSAVTRTLVTSEGTAIQTGSTHARVYFAAEASAADGSLVSRERVWDSRKVAELPSVGTLLTGAQSLSREVLALREADVVSPFVGPVIFEGRAAAILFHEVLGHRVEGHRVRSTFEGGTFADRLGEAVMSRGFDVYDDPTLERVNGQVLLGTYLFDDEGVAAERAHLIADGVLAGFLSTRAPLPGKARSTGHARRETAYRPFSRQANLIVEPKRVISAGKLTEALRAEIRGQKSGFGLRVVDAEGGSTTTERGDSQTFRIYPTLAYLVYADGREQLVRGLTLEGTPLALLGSIVVAADSWGVFDGVCGAESGFVPVAAVSPALLVRSLEVTRDEQDRSGPPLLPPPELVRRSSVGARRRPWIGGVQ